jgi:hypothetical protein
MRWSGPGEAVKVAVRPENVQLGGSGEANRLLARTTGQRYQGTQTIYELAVLVCRLLSVWPNKITRRGRRLPHCGISARRR